MRGIIKLVRIGALLLSVLSACNTKQRIVRTFPDGSPLAIFEYDYKNSSKFNVFVFYKQGNLRRKLIVENGKFVDSITVWDKQGRIEQIDSLTEPCDTTTLACTGVRKFFYPNKLVSEQYTLVNGRYNGLTRHFDTSGKLVKEYFLVDDSIKNGQYREFDASGHVAFAATYSKNELAGFVYYFKNGDTTKYYNTYKGGLSFPYKKWLGNGNVLIGNYLDSSYSRVIWTWIDKEGHSFKSKVSGANRKGFVAPE